jgi:hypothetical protein
MKSVSSFSYLEISNTLFLMRLRIKVAITLESLARSL